jgi:hypothetical protein
VVVDRSVEGAGERLERDAHRVPGPALLPLHDAAYRRMVLGEVLGDGVTAVTDDDDDVLRVQLGRRGEHVTEQRPPEDAVQHLG